MNKIELTGLKGDNPMSFLAALGVLVAHPVGKAKLYWREGVSGTAVLDTEYDRDELSELIIKDKDKVLEWGLLEFPGLRFSEQELEVFLRGGGREELLLRQSLTSDFIVDKSKGLSKPTDLDFTSGQQGFLKVASELVSFVDKTTIEEALYGPWTYRRSAKTFIWDPRDDRQHAYRAFAPTDEKKVTIPGADWLAFRAMSLVPSFSMLREIKNKEEQALHLGRVLTPGGYSNRSREGWSWPLWNRPISASSIRTLLQALPRSSEKEYEDWNAPKGVFAVYSSDIFEVGQGYGRFFPPRLVWSEE